VFQSMWSGLCKECRTEFDTTIDFGQNIPNFIIVQTLHKTGVLNLFRPAEHFGPKKIPRNNIKKITSEVVCFYC
jgi:hypothetical protein